MGWLFDLTAAWVFPLKRWVFPPKSSIFLIGFSMDETIHFGGFPPIFGNTRMDNLPR